MSTSDIKHSLRKYDFPQCAKEALIKIEQLLSSRMVSSKQLDLVMDIISEFLFLETDRRSSRRSSGLNPLQELMLIDIVSEYLSANKSETTNNTIFLSLFGGTDNPKRIKVLCTLASMAVSASNNQMLLAVGTWLQQTGCSSPLSHQLAESIVRDHFYLQSSSDALDSLATLAPQFLANFMASVTDLYLHEGKDMAVPPKNLLQVITNWVYSNPSLCMSAQLTPLTLPTGAIPMAAVTPIAGLIHWCSIAPLCISQDVEMEDHFVAVKKIKLEDDNTLKPSKEAPTDTESELYKKLHLGVLNSLKMGRKSHGPPTAVNAQHLGCIAPIIMAKAKKLSIEGFNLATHPQLQESLDRIAQATQVALANSCVYGSIPTLLATLNTLPENRLLRMVITTHTQSI